MHGEKLPEVTGVKVFWNAKSYAYELFAIKNTAEGVRPVIRCRHCNQMWSFDGWDDLWDYIPDAKLKERLSVYHNIQEMETA